MYTYVRVNAVFVEFYLHRTFFSIFFLFIFFTLEIGSPRKGTMGFRVVPDKTLCFLSPVSSSSGYPANVSGPCPEIIALRVGLNTRLLASSRWPAAPEFCETSPENGFLTSSLWSLFRFDLVFDFTVPVFGKQHDEIRYPLLSEPSPNHAHAPTGGSNQRGPPNFEFGTTES